MKKRFILFWIITITMSSFAGDHYICHLAESGWTTSITVYNDTTDTQTFDLHRFDAEGTESVISGFAVPANGFLVLNNTDFGYDGTAFIRTPDEQSQVFVKLTYQYGESLSVCEFFLPNNETGSSWVLTNPYQEHFDWFGLAVANFNETDVFVDLTAWKNGSIVGTKTESISHGGKIVNISSGFWPGINYDDVDRVTIESDQTIPPPISITGNDAQDRHVFFPGQPEIVSDPPFSHSYSVHHIAESIWTSELTIFNPNDSDAAIALSSWNGNGNVDVENDIRTVPTKGSLVLTVGEDFTALGTAKIDSENDILVKLSYQYGESESICEFFLNENESNQWFLPYPAYGWMDWSGFAVSNPYDTTLYFTLIPYQDGFPAGEAIYDITPHKKEVRLLEDVFNALGMTPELYENVSHVIIRANQPIQAPIYITGNGDQDRHIFYKASSDKVDPIFPDPAFKAYILENFDTDENGEISSSEAEAVTVIDCSGEYSNRGNIQDLTGVEIFTNLREFRFKYNSVNWIPDLSMLTQLYRLEGDYNEILFINGDQLPLSIRILYFRHNLISSVSNLNQLTDLTDLDFVDNLLNEFCDISVLTNLTYLALANNNLSEIPGIVNCTKMRALAIGENQFTICPDYSGMTDMRWMEFDKNQLTTIPDLSGLSQMTMLNCSRNNITELPGLSGLNSLDNLQCGYNQIASLDDLAGISTLENLNCPYNNIISLPDLSHFPNLIYLTLDYNEEITELPGLTSCPNLISLNTLGTGIGDFSGLSGNTSLKYFYASQCPVTALPDFSTLTGLEYLYLNECGLTDVPDVTSCTALNDFGCSKNFFDSGDCPMIQAIEAMGLSYFSYNPLFGGELLDCD